jgi:hypothetical protein
MIKILTILILIGMAAAHIPPVEKPSDLIEQHAKPGVINLSGADFDKIFSSPMMQLQSLGMPPKGYATDLRINPKYTLEALINWSRKEPAEIGSITQ